MADFQEDVQAQFAALLMAVSAALKAVADSTGDPKRFLSEALENGLREMGNTDFVSIPAIQKEAFLENARARYTSLIVGIPVAG
jgi:hypothetical protein